MSNPKTLIRLSAAIMATSLWMVGSAHGAVQNQLLQFEPIPVSPGLAEFSWVGAAGGPQAFVASPGATGNGDGGSAISAQTPGGLEVDTPLTVTGVPGSINDGSGTHFYDVTLSLSAPTGAPSLVGTTATVLPGLGLATQNLSNGVFTMTATDGTTILLEGTFTNNSITSPLSSTSSTFGSALVTYTGGALFNEMVREGYALSGSASISMTSLDGPVSTNITGPTTGSGLFEQAPATINPYDSNGTGVFDVAKVPEPVSTSMLLMLGSLGFRRRR